MYTINDLYDLTHTLAGDYLARFTYPWEALSDLADCIRALGAQLDSEYLPFGPEVWVHRTAHVAPTASITGPCIIGPETEVRHCAFIRGSALVGNDCVVGNSTELKNVILFDRVQVPHYNYVGDSVLGYKAHFGAGVITSNVKGDKSLVVVKAGGERYPTNRKKVGALAGDFAEVGCNTVLNPGTIIGRRGRIYPLCSVRGFVPEGHLLKNNGTCSPQE